MRVEFWHPHAAAKIQISMGRRIAIGGQDTCPLTLVECQKTNVIYVASVTSQGRVEHYTGLTGGTFKKRWDKHQSDIRLKRKKTTLSRYVLKLEEEGKQYSTKWEILDRAPTFNPVTKKCRLCLKEIYYIIFRPDSASLNSRNELFNTCRHRRTDLLLYSWRNPNIFILVQKIFKNPKIFQSSSPSDECGEPYETNL